LLKAAKGGKTFRSLGKERGSRNPGLGKAGTQAAELFRDMLSQRIGLRRIREKDRYMNSNKKLNKRLSIGLKKGSQEGLMPSSQGRERKCRRTSKIPYSPSTLKKRKRVVSRNDNLHTSKGRGKSTLCKSTDTWG